MEGNTNDTVPGFMLQSKNFTLKFTGGFQKGERSYLLEYETDWLDLMEILASCLEVFPSSIQSAQESAARKLRDHILTHEGLNINVRVEMTEKVIFRPPLGSNKQVDILFNDSFKTRVSFHVKRKNKMRALVDLSSEEVAGAINTEEDIERLEIPITLDKGLVLALRNNWTPRFYRQQITCCSKHREGLKKNLRFISGVHHAITFAK